MEDTSKGSAPHDEPALVTDDQQTLPLEETLPDGCKRYWPFNGRAWNGTTEGRKKILLAVAEVEWQPTPARMAVMPGMGIQKMIEEFRIPRPLEVGTAFSLAPVGLLAVCAKYRNGVARIFAVDTGVEIVPVLTEFTPAAPSQGAGQG